MEYIIGADECGYGCLAGDVVVCAVKAPKDWNLEGLNDSKKLSENKRYLMRDKLIQLAESGEISYSITYRDNKYIDEVGIYNSLKICYNDAILSGLFPIVNESIIIDGNLNFNGFDLNNQNIKSVIKADTIFPVVMAASILGKTYRDDKMKDLDNLHPEYNWKNNKGYGTKDHIDAIKKYGLCDLHRKSYKIKL